MEGTTYVIPVSRARLQCRALKSEGALPAALFRRVLGKRKLTLVAIPRANEVDRLAVGRGPECEVQLYGCHYCDMSGYCSVFFFPKYMVGSMRTPNVIDSFEQEELSISLVIPSRPATRKRSKVNEIKVSVETK